MNRATTWSIRVPPPPQARSTTPLRRVRKPISLPIGNVFGERPWWTADDSREHHRCWFCSEPGQRTTTWPPMPPGCTLCACCGILIYTGYKDPGNDAMRLCERCEDWVAERDEQDDFNTKRDDPPSAT